MPFLPTTLAEARDRGWDELDIVIVTGDAYVDHPSFGAAIIGRHLEAAGFRVGIIPQPDWRKDEDFLALGTPRLFFGVTAGNMDSLVNHYTAQRRLRHNDAYSPDGVSGKRPDRACIIYTNMLKRLFKQTPIVLGGIEASLRRIAHYDYWQNKVRASILADSKADFLVYGMGENASLEIARALQNGTDPVLMKKIPGTVVFSDKAPPDEGLILPDNLACVDKATFRRMTRLFEDHYQSDVIHQINGNRWIRHNPPARALPEQELDRLYGLPFDYAPHPRYDGTKIPAFEQIRHSITSHRGCYGGCNYCSLSLHQGRRIRSRSGGSIISEAARHAEKSGKPITITDVGGPTANMYKSFCALDFPLSCKRPSCLFPEICPNLRTDPQAQLELLAKIEAIPGINHVFIASGIRHDLALQYPRLIEALAEKYTGGRLKLAPEHSSPKVLRLMGKPDISSFETFARHFFQYSKKAGLKRQIIPYIIIGHPGTTMQDALELRRWLIRNNLHVEQVQEFTPTPMTISTCMYYTGLDYETGRPIHIPQPGEVRRQKELALWHQKKA